jgi:hypothetical protein
MDVLLEAGARSRLRVLQSDRGTRAGASSALVARWCATLLSSLVLSGCPLNDDYAIDRDSGTAEQGEAGRSSSPTGDSGDAPSLAESGGAMTGGSQGMGVTTGGSTTHTGGAAETGGDSTATGGSPTNTAGASGDTGAAGGSPTDTGGVSSGSGEAGMGDDDGGTATGGVFGETGGTRATGGVDATGGAEAAVGGAGHGASSNAGAAGQPPDDECPEDPDKTRPGLCGCSLAETQCLVHRYSFDGSGTSVVDSVGGDDGTVVHGTLSSGAVDLSGSSFSAGYVQFPKGILSELTDATLEVWVNWRGGAAWQRIVDFGDSSYQTSSIPHGRTYLFLTPKNGTTNKLRASFSLNGTDRSVNVDASQALPIDETTYVTVVVDDAAGRLELYVNAEHQGSVALTGSLADINDVNNWMGRSQASDDPYFDGTVEEFRVYRVVRTAEQIAESYESGPDALPGG